MRNISPETCFRQCQGIVVKRNEIPDELICPKICYPRTGAFCRLKRGDKTPDACPFGTNRDSSQDIQPDGSRLKV